MGPELSVPAPAGGPYEPDNECSCRFRVEYCWG